MHGRPRPPAPHTHTRAAGFARPPLARTLTRGRPASPAHPTHPTQPQPQAVESEYEEINWRALLTSNAQEVGGAYGGPAYPPAYAPAYRRSLNELDALLHTLSAAESSHSLGSYGPYGGYGHESRRMLQAAYGGYVSAVGCLCVVVVGGGGGTPCANPQT